MIVARKPPRTEHHNLHAHNRPPNQGEGLEKPPSSTQRLNPTTALPRFPSLQIHPPLHTPRLHTNHLLIPIRYRAKITHPLGLVDPRIPHHHFIDARIGGEFQDRFLVLEDLDWMWVFGFCGRGVGSGERVDAIGFRGEGDGGGGRGFGGGVLGFVDVRGGGETRDTGGSDVLCSVISIAINPLSQKDLVRGKNIISGRRYL